MKADSFPFNSHVAEYEEWFEKHQQVFETELNAIKSLLPGTKDLEGLEIGVATGRFAKALKIHHGIEPAENMRQLALKRGIHAIDGVAENLPYKGLSFDYVLMNFYISHFNDVRAAFVEAWRVLRYNGFLIVTFLKKNSSFAGNYENREESTFYQQARFYTAQEVTSMLTEAGFNTIEFCQTIFHQPEKMNSGAEETLPCYRKGSYFLIKATKSKHTIKN